MINFFEYFFFLRKPKQGTVSLATVVCQKGSVLMEISFYIESVTYLSVLYFVQRQLNELTLENHWYIPVSYGRHFMLI